MAKITDIPHRIVNVGDVVSATTISVYEAGTSTLIDLYDDATLTNLIDNPLEIPSGNPIPPLYHDFAGLVRIQITNASGTIFDDDPYDQPVSANDLSSVSGAGLVGLQQSGTNTRARTVAEKSNEVVSVSDFVDIGPQGTNDASAGFTQAIHDGRSLLFPNGVIRIDSDLTLSPQALDLSGSGKNSILDFSGGGSLYLKTDPMALPDLAADVVGGQNRVEFAIAHGLNEGDVFALWNPTDGSFFADRPYYRDGAMFRVAEVVSLTELRIYGVAKRNFSAANFKTYKISGGRVSLKNLHIIPNASGGVPLFIDGYQGVNIEGISCDSGAPDTAICLKRCYDFHVAGTRSTVQAGDAYPVIIANCQKGIVDHLVNYSTRHCVAFGGGSGDATVPTADIEVSHCLFDNIASNGIGAMDGAHGNCEDIIFSHNILKCGLNLGGANMTYLNNIIYGAPPPANGGSGLCAYGSEIKGGVFTFIGNRFITWGDGASFGIVHCDVSEREEDFLLIAHDNVMENRGSATTIRAWRIEIGSVAGAHRVDTEIDGFAFKGIKPQIILGLSGVADISGQSSFSIGKLTGLTGTVLVGASNPVNYNAMMRMPRVTGQTTLSTIIGQAVAITSAIALPYSYPRAPRCGATVISSTPVNVSPSGSRRVLAQISAITASTIRPCILTGDSTAWSSAENRLVDWWASIDDF